MAGRKDLYKTKVEPYLDEINKKIRQGVTEAEIAKSLGVSVATFANYKNQHPELVEALSKDKGADVLQKLVNAGIEAATGYYKENEVTKIVIGQDGQPKKEKTVTKTWYPPNPALNKFYVMNYGRDEGYANDPLDYELKKAKAELDEQLTKDKHWPSFDE